MLGFNYKRLDAFRNGNSSGNPAGVVYLGQEEVISEQQMLAIAKQEKGIVSEVVFCRLLEEGLYSLKYYSSECEVSFCGHGTIACMYDLIHRDPALLKRQMITIRTVKGDLKVYNEIDHSDSVFITAPAAQYLPCFPGRKEIAESLGITVEQLDHNDEIEVIDAGLTTLIVPLASLDILLRLKPDFTTLQEFCLKYDIDLVLVFSSEVFQPENRFRTRVFPPKIGYLEDPATGSGNAAFGYYLLKHKHWDGSTIISIEQGPNRENPNVIKVDASINDGVQQVLIGGKAIAR